jgi:P4 family phage/plasmid primase-like protien
MQAGVPLKNVRLPNHPNLLRIRPEVTDEIARLPDLARDELFQKLQKVELADVAEWMQARLDQEEHVAPDFMGRFSQSDHMSIAEAVIDRIKRKEGDGHAPLIWDESTFWVYKDGYWSPFSDNMVKKVVARINRWAVPMSDRQENFSVNDGFVRSVYNVVKVEADSKGFFSGEIPVGIGFRNGFVQVSDRGIHISEHKAENRQRHAHDFDWDPNAECPRWLQFLEEVFARDDDKEEKKRFLAQFLGATLTGQAAVHNRAVLLIGVGANGKSVLCDVVEGLFPPKAVSSIPPHVMSNPNRVHVLSGALLNIVTDIPTKELKDAGGFKQVISGDPIEGRRLYENPFRFRPVAGHIFSANELPLAHDHSTGFFRRWVVMDFNSRFDPSVAIPRDELVASLLNERPGIMRWALEGAVDLMTVKGLFVPSSHERNIEGWKRHSNQVQAYKADMILEEYKCDTDRPGLTSQRVYDNYKAWAEACHKIIMSKQAFCRRLSALDVPNRRLSTGRHWGVTLRSAGGLAEMPDHSSSDDKPEDDKETEIG